MLSMLPILRPNGSMTDKGSVHWHRPSIVCGLFKGQRARHNVTQGSNDCIVALLHRTTRYAMLHVKECDVHIVISNRVIVPTPLSQEETTTSNSCYFTCCSMIAKHRCTIVRLSSLPCL